MTSRIERLCLKKGLKMTDQRRIIARVLSEAADHPDVEGLHQRAAAADPRISIATVYRTVKLWQRPRNVKRAQIAAGNSVTAIAVN